MTSVTETSTPAGATSAASGPTKSVVVAAPRGYCACYSPDGRCVASGGSHDCAVRVWDAATGRELRKYEGHQGKVTAVVFFPDGKRLASASEDGTVRVWRAPR